MIRCAIGGLVIVALLLPFTLRADDPPAGQEEPPVRLKKKDRPNVPKDDPMKKPDPEKRPEPEKKPDPKPEAKPDRQDEPNVPEPAESEEEILQRLIRNTKKAQDRLANSEVDEATRQLQRDILKDIESLIKKSDSDQGGEQDQQQQQNQQQQQGQQGQQGQKQQQGGGGGKPQSGRQQRQQARKQQGRGQQQARGNPGNQQGNQQGDQQQNNQQAGTSNQGGAGGKSQDELNKIADLYKDVWGHLPETLRAEMNAYSREKFMAKHKDLIEKYYSNLAEKNRKGQ